MSAYGIGTSEGIGRVDGIISGIMDPWLHNFMGMLWYGEKPRDGRIALSKVGRYLS